MMTLRPLLLSCAFLTVFGSTSAFAFGAAPQKTFRVMPYGDSITEGGYNEDGTWYSEGGYRIGLWQMLDQTGYDVHFVGSASNGDFPEANHEGHSGWRIDQVDAQSEQWVRDANPDFILLMIGTNDCNQNYQMDTIITRLKTLIAHLQSAGPHAQLFVSNLFYTNSPATNSRIDLYNSGLEPLIRAKAAVDPRVHFVDFQSVIGNGEHGTSDDLIDGVHPSPDGYALMAKTWFNQLKPYLNE
jgi:lysophospholipase L1-like esterase